MKVVIFNNILIIISMSIGIFISYINIKEISEIECSSQIDKEKEQIDFLLKFHLLIFVLDSFSWIRDALMYETIGLIDLIFYFIYSYLLFLWYYVEK